MTKAPMTKELQKSKIPNQPGEREFQRGIVEMARGF
jgi:hypothetical protein